MKHVTKIISIVLITTTLLSLLGVTALAESGDYTIKDGVLTSYM